MIDAATARPEAGQQRAGRPSRSVEYAVHRPPSAGRSLGELSPELTISCDWDSMYEREDEVSAAGTCDGARASGRGGAAG